MQKTTVAHKDDCSSSSMAMISTTLDLPGEMLWGLIDLADGEGHGSGSSSLSGGIRKRSCDVSSVFRDVTSASNLIGEEARASRYSGAEMATRSTRGEDAVPVGYWDALVSDHV